jgi:hypothetical protein
MKYTYVYTDGSKGEIVTISRNLLTDSTMTAAGFEEVFFDETRTSITYIEAYEKAETFHEEVFGKRRYSDYDSFRKAKDQKHNKKNDTR